MVLERKLMKMVQVMWEYSRMEREMVKVHTLTTAIIGNRILRAERPTIETLDQGTDTLSEFGAKLFDRVYIPYRDKSQY